MGLAVGGLAQIAIGHALIGSLDLLSSSLFGLAAAYGAAE